MIFSAFAYNNQQQIALDSLSKIPYNSNNIKFNFTIPLAENAHYIYYLKNGEKIISETTQNNSVDFLSLNEGNYSFWVENADDKNQKSNVLKFSIQAPWYRSWLAYFFYFLSVIGIFLFVRYFQNLNLKKQRKEMLKKEQLSLREQAEKHKEKLLQNQQEQMILERKALEDKVKDKTMELAKSAKENKDKNRILHFIKEKLDEIEKDPTSTKAKLRLAEIRRILNDNFFEDDQIFELQIDELHQNFFKKMKEKFPELTTYDLRLASYLKMSMNSKEIAEIVDVLPSSINVSRSRLRKKLDLDATTDLYEFLNNL